MDFTRLTPDELLTEVKKHRDIAERAAIELLRRASGAQPANGA